LFYFCSLSIFDEGNTLIAKIRGRVSESLRKLKKKHRPFSERVGLGLVVNKNKNVIYDRVHRSLV